MIIINNMIMMMMMCIHTIRIYIHTIFHTIYTHTIHIGHISNVPCV